uniref:NADH-ubiquinone oxidoreductase chain 6 n=1 Tax=Scaphidium quadrimaculatum TaxID=295644 RepID=A0A0S2M8A0_SCAQU|nr:NADH dehydrogenase subunit 6 [Scaphidium quadrimaculatum]ALO70889.1 NADH deshydrogenase subunit 6 [Scaphidium quadrimaculatum]
MMMIMFNFSMLFLMLTHPLSMGLMLLLQTIMISLITSKFMLNFWFSYILFLVMVSGMLVLFIYMTSLASNEKFKYSNKLMFLTFLTMMLFLLMNKFTINYLNLNLLTWNIDMNFFMSLNKFINFPSNLIMILLMIYLLITLIAIVKITNISMGPLRQKF